MCNIWLFVVLKALQFVSNAHKLSSSTILTFDNSAEKIALLISIDTDKSEKDTVTMVIIAPIYHNYVAIGFGSHQMKSTYSIIFYSNNNIEEYYLSSKGLAQKQLNSSIAIQDIEYERDTMAVIITRDINGISDYHYSFNHIDDMNELDIIYAMSNHQNVHFHHTMENNLDYHGIYKDFTTLMFSQVLDINKTENDFIDDLFDINQNQTESILYLTTDDIDDNLYDDDKIFMFLDGMQWIVIGAIFCCFIIMLFILMLFFRCYRGRTKNWEMTNQQKLGYKTPEIQSIVQHCYNPSASILTQLDNDNDNDNNYNYYIDNNNNPSIGSIDDFLMRMITQDNNNNGNHDLIRIDDDNDENISDLSDNDSVRM